jgi:16S rRNA (uracil1498-N3)-methyltransferase
MSIPRFYCAEPLLPNQTCVLSETVAHHIRVLRLAAGSDIVLFDGTGGEITGTLDFNGKIATVVLQEHRPRESELGGQITLLQGLPAGDKMDWVIEKAVELGVHRIVPIAAQRSVLQLSGPRLEKRLSHWMRTIESASEQCGRNRLMQIQAPLTLEKALAEQTLNYRLLCDPEGELDFQSWLGSPAANLQAVPSLTLLIGPEGGWCQQELACARKHGAHSVRFGTRVLRTETAALAMVAAATALLGW